MLYAGIGSQETPNDILNLMYSLARYMAVHKHTLRSGGARGADTAFEDGCVSKQGKMEIYLPFAGFNHNESLLFGAGKEARLHGRNFHPNWANVSCTGRDFLARNSYQILGSNLRTPADFVVCWTPKGKTVGGTGQAIRMAEHYEIPIFNFGSMTKDEVNEGVMALIT
jgi:hypothetical protein